MHGMDIMIKKKAWHKNLHLYCFPTYSVGHIQCFQKYVHKIICFNTLHDTTLLKSSEDSPTCCDSCNCASVQTLFHYIQLFFYFSDGNKLKLCKRGPTKKRGNTIPLFCLLPHFSLSTFLPPPLLFLSSSQACDFLSVPSQHYFFLFLPLTLAPSPSHQSLSVPHQYFVLLLAITSFFCTPLFLSLFLPHTIILFLLLPPYSITLSYFLVTSFTPPFVTGKAQVFLPSHCCHFHSS